MKKNYLWMAAMASLLSFTACNNDVLPDGNDETLGQVVTDEGTTLELAISNTGISTRGARPVGSSAAANNVNKVQLQFYKMVGDQWQVANVTAHQIGTKDMEGAYPDNIVDFTENISEGVPGTTDRIEEKKKIRLVGLEAGVKYRIVAYGYNGDGFPYGDATAQGTSGLFNAENITKSGYDLEEVFAGYVDKSTKENQSKFESAPVVEITRQVAGILAYFKIPTHANGDIVKTVKVIANAKSTGFQFPNTLLAKNAPFNGLGTQAGDVVLMEFDMTKAMNWKPEEQTDDYYTTNGAENDYEANTYKNGLAVGYEKNIPANLELKGNTFFGARFILPYDKHITAEGSQTLKVVMYNAKSEALKTLKVTTGKIPEEGTAYNYDIRCNNFYSIGKKMVTGSTSGKPDPENPDPDPENPDADKPIDLGATDQIIVEINDAWDILHDMGIEE